MAAPGEDARRAHARAGHRSPGGAPRQATFAASERSIVSRSMSGSGTDLPSA